MNSDLDHLILVQRLAQQLRSRQLLLAAAESCTGGGVAHACTAVAGSSDWFAGAFVSYSNRAKTRMLGVPPELIDSSGAVSEAVARAMAEGALAHSEAHVTVAITGVAGPGGGSEHKPVGTVCFAWAQQGCATSTERALFSGDRASVREQAVARALQGLITQLDQRT